MELNTPKYETSPNITHTYIYPGDSYFLFSHFSVQKKSERTALLLYLILSNVIW